MFLGQGRRQAPVPRHSTDQDRLCIEKLAEYRQDLQANNRSNGIFKLVIEYEMME